MRLTLQLLATASVLLLAACSPPASKTAEQSKPAPRAVATIQDIMLSEVDPAADALWGAVGSVITTSGTQELGPRTQEEWDVVRGHAVTLVEAPNLLVMPGRSVSGSGKLIDEGKYGIQTAAQIQAKIDSDPALFLQLARNLQISALDALSAVKAKDKPALIDAGERIDTACEQCHLTYWYPTAKSGPGKAP